MSNEANDFLMGSAVPSAKFPVVGTTVTGVITEDPAVVDQKDLDGNVKTWDNGDPQKMLVVTLQTADRDPEITDDDGMRKLYVKGSKNPESKSMTAALSAAVKKARAKGLEIGGKVTVTYVGDGKQDKKGFNPPKQFEAVYEAPSVAASGEFLGASEPVQEEIPSAAANPAQAAKELIAAGLSDADITAATGLAATTVAALRNVA
jgi:hypothetical protein